MFHWGKSDLDHILVEGNCLYKSLGFLADQLPGFVKMLVAIFLFDILGLKHSWLH